MADITSRDIVDQIQQLNFNPSEIHRIILNGIQQNTEGTVTLFNPSNPMMGPIEAGILTSTSVLQEFRTLTRSLYAPAVDKWDELYLHQQDDDLEEMVSQPGEATINIFMAVGELKQKALPISDDSDIKMVEFPRHTQITVGDYTLMFKYPFTIRINRHGNISIKYNLSGDDTLGTITNALIEFKYLRYNDVDVIMFPLEVVQVALKSSVIPVSQSSGFRRSIKINDNLFRLKAYTRFSQNSNWIEIDVTRRLKALNRNKTTIQLIEGDGEITLCIPPFYLINGMMGSEVRLDIYTTKGEIEHPLVNYSEAAYKLQYFDYNNPNNKYAGLLGSFSILRVYSTDTILGGRNRLSFNEAKNRVINRSSISEGIPITELELNNKLMDYGMSSTLVIDNVTDRIFAASKLLPTPDVNLTVTGMGCNVQSHQTTMEILAGLVTSRDNGSRVTVLPNTLYNVVNGVLNVVDNDTVATMTDPAITAPESLATWANANELVYTPYFYVHDVSNNEYAVRPYRLDDPKISNKYTVDENPTLQLDAGVYNYQLVMNTDMSGYTLYLGIAVGDNFKEIPLSDISLQISYTDESGENRYYLNGVLDTPVDVNTGRPLNDSYVYRFDLNTNWDINSDHQLILSDSFIPVPLECDMDVFIIVKGYQPVGFTPTTMDNVINLFSLTNYDGQTIQAALIQERISLKLGSYMSNIWNRARTTIDINDYKLYEEDIPAVYSEDVYQRDSNGVIELWYNPETKKLEPIYLHRKGETVVIDGVIQYKHKVGDIVLENGEPVLKEGLRGLKCQYDLVVMDGLYYLTTHSATISYVKTVLNTIDSWVFDILRDQVTPELLQRTSVLYHPKSTVGSIEVYVENGIKALVKSDQQLYIRLFVGDAVYNNIDLRNSLELTTKTVIQTVLQTKQTMSVSDLTKAVSDSLGENILGIDLKGFMNDEYNTITVVDALTTPSIGKRLSVNSKLELVIEDDVEIEFVWHSKREN